MRTDAEFVCAANTDEWKLERNGGVGSSDGPAAMGFNKNCPPRTLYHRKLGQLPGPDDDDDFMWFGHQLEPVALAAFERRTGIRVEKHAPGMYRHPVYDFILATPDAFVADGNLAECKAVSFYSPNNPFRSDEFGDEGSDEIPDTWFLQCQQQMAVMGCESVHVCVLLNGMQLLYYQVNRNDQLITAMAHRLAEFWECVQTETPPDWGVDERSTDTIRKIYNKVDRGTAVVLSPIATEALRKERELAKVESSVKKARDACKAVYLEEMKNSQVAISCDGEEMIERKLVNRSGYIVEPSMYVRSHVAPTDSQLKLAFEQGELLSAMEQFNAEEVRKITDNSVKSDKKKG